MKGVRFILRSLRKRALGMQQSDAMKIPYIASGMALSFLVFSASLQAAPVVYTTSLSASAEADPTNESTGTGKAWFTHDWDTHMWAESDVF